MKTFKKWFSRGIFSLLVIFLILSAIASVKSCTAKQPDTEWGIQTYTNDEFRTPSRCYYGDTLEYKEGYPVLKNEWWSFDGNGYHRHHGDKEFTPLEYGIVDVIRRKAK
jgi:hypothetical protein